MQMLGTAPANPFHSLHNVKPIISSNKFHKIWREKKRRTNISRNVASIFWKNTYEWLRRYNSIEGKETWGEDQSEQWE